MGYVEPVVEPVIDKSRATRSGMRPRREILISQFWVAIRTEKR
jgi:hypothetical protein